MAAGNGGMRAPGGSAPRAPKPKVVKVKAHERRVPPPRAPKPNPLAAPITPGSGITVAQARRMASNATRVRYGGQEQGINQQLASTQQLGKDQAGWYQQYQAQLAKYAQDAQDRANATNTAMQQQADSIRGLDQSNLNDQQKAMNADAAARGATASPQVSTDASNASIVRQALEGSLGALLAARGGAAATQASNLAHVVAPIQAGQAMAANAKQQGSIRDQLTALKGTEGAYAQSFIDSLTASEAKNLLAASIAAGKDLTATTVARTKAGAQVKTARAKAKAQANTPSAQKTKAELAYFNKHGYWPPTGPPKPGKAGKQPKPAAGPGSLPPSAEAKIVSQIHQVVAMIQRAPKTDSKGVPLTDHELRTRLAGTNNPFKRIIDPRIVNIAFDIARNGGLSTPNVKAAHDLGIHVNGHFKVLKNTRLTAQQQKTDNGIFGIPTTGGTGVLGGS